MVVLFEINADWNNHRGRPGSQADDEWWMSVCVSVRTHLLLFKPMHSEIIITKAQCAWFEQQ